MMIREKVAVTINLMGKTERIVISVFSDGSYDMVKSEVERYVKTMWTNYFKIDSFSWSYTA
jgi:hypothetical protein